MSLLPITVFLLLLLPGLALARRLAPDELRGGLLPGIAASWMTLLVVLAPLVIVGYLFGAPLWALNALLVAAIAWGALDALRRRAWKGAGALLAGAGAFALLVLAIDLYLSYRHGAILDNDSRVHIARIRFLMEHGLTNSDPFIRTPHEYPYPIYHTNLWHALVASVSSLTGLDPVETWFNALVVSKLFIATGAAYLAWSVFGGQWAAAVAIVMIVVNRGPYTFSVYPNQLAPWAMLPVAVGVLSRALASQYGERPWSWTRTACMVGGTAFVVSAFHPMYGGFLAVLATPVACVVCVERLLRKRSAYTALIATAAVGACALAFPLASRGLTARGVDRNVVLALESPEWHAKRDAMREAMRLERTRPRDAEAETSGLGATGRDPSRSERAPDEAAAAAEEAARRQGPADDAAGNAMAGAGNSRAGVEEPPDAPAAAADAPRKPKRHHLIRPMDGFDFYDRGGDDWIARSPWRGFLGGFSGVFWWRLWLLAACTGLAVWRLRRIEPLILVGTVAAIEAVVLIPPLCTMALKFLGAGWMLGRFETLAFVLWTPLGLPALAAVIEAARAWSLPRRFIAEGLLCAAAIPLAWLHASHRAPYDWTRFRAEAMKSEGARVGRQLAGLMKNQQWMRDAMPEGAVVLSGTLTGTWIAMLHDASLVASERSSTGVPGGRLRRVHVDEMFSPDTDEGRRADLFDFYGVTHVVVAGPTPIWARYWTVGGTRGHGHVVLKLRQFPDADLLWLREVMVAAAQLDRGNPRGAIERIAPIAELHPDSAEVWYTLGNAQMVLRERVDLAEQAYRRAVELDAEEPLHALMLGNALAAQGRHDEAERVFEDCVKLALLQSNPLVAAASAFNRGNSLYQLDRYEEALAQYERALEFDPRHRKAQTARGWLRQDLGLDLPAPIDPAISPAP